MSGPSYFLSWNRLTLMNNSAYVIDRIYIRWNSLIDLGDSFYVITRAY